MAHDALSLVKSRRFGSTAKKAVMLVLADYADADWSTFAGQGRIAAEAEISERTVRRILADFEAEGLVRRQRRHREDGSRTSDRIKLVHGVIVALPDTMADRAYRTLWPPLPDTVTEPTGHSLAAHEPSEEPSEEPSVISSKLPENAKSLLPTKSKPLTITHSRQVHDGLVFALIAAAGWRQDEITETQWGALHRAAKTLADVGADPDEIRRRWIIYQVNYPGTVTPSALAKHWAGCREAHRTLTDRQRRQLAAVADQTWQDHAATLGGEP